MWMANWIWCRGEERPRNFYLYIRKSFKLSVKPSSGRLHVSADSRYKLFVNGRYVGRGPERYVRGWQSYDSWDVAQYLKEGWNVVAALVHHYGEWTFSYMLGRGGFICVLEVDGRLVASSDKTWKVKPATAWDRGIPRMSIQLGFNEVYDAREEPIGWVEVGFDDSCWEDGLELGRPRLEPWIDLVPRSIPLMMEKEILPVKIVDFGDCEVMLKEVEDPKNIARLMETEKRLPLEHGRVENIEALLKGCGEGSVRVSTGDGRGVYIVIDFGREVAGYPRVEFKDACGGEVVDLGYCEALEDGGGDFIPPAMGGVGKVNPNRGGVRYADRYVCRAGAQTFETFDKRAFRFLQIDVRNASKGLGIGKVSLLFSTYPVQWRGLFECSDRRLNEIWRVGAYTLQLNMEDSFTDCPWRERGQWWGDAYVEFLCSFYAFGDLKLMRKGLLQIGLSQTEEGLTWGVFPTDWGGGRLPDYTLIWIISLWDYYFLGGDRQTLHQLYVRVQRAIKFFEGFEDEHGLLNNVPYWVFIDWADVDKRGEITALNCFYVGALKAAEKIASACGDLGNASSYRGKAEAVAKAINVRLWDSGEGVYRDCRVGEELSRKISQQANSLAILYEIAPRENWDKILNYIHDPAKEVVQSGSPYFSFYVLGALFKAGRSSQALKYIKDRWGEMLDWGCTTWWEVWSPKHSLCHGWSSAPTYYLPAEVLGVKPLHVGWRKLQVKPNPLDLREVKAIIPSPIGDVEVSYRKDGDGEEMHIVIPSEAQAEVMFPESAITHQIEGPGKFIFTRNAEGAEKVKKM